MSLQPRRPMLDALRDSLSKLEAHSGEETGTQAELKLILRDRIAELEAAQRPKSGN
jgi:aerobic-type carbon monoxide dehydrogenase small subunit (CoxS/CutS family)